MKYSITLKNPIEGKLQVISINISIKFWNGRSGAVFIYRERWQISFHEWRLQCALHENNLSQMGLIYHI